MKHIVFICAEDEYRSEETLPELAEEAGDALGAAISIVSAPDVAEPGHLPGLDVLNTADLAVFYMRFRKLPLQQFESIREYLQAGKPVVGLRTSTHAFQYPTGHPLEEWNQKFGVEVLGAPWIRHFGHSSTTDVSIAWGNDKHPILKDVPKRFEARSWLYHVLPFPPEGADILLNGSAVNPEEWSLTDDPPRIHPVAWTHTHFGGGRVFTTTLGHPEDFAIPAFRNMLINGMRWTLEDH